ncbi:MAG: flagellin [Candidatus Bathyarchaeota archaeon]|nr:flagellin [Candidatus Bathyarchaeota archaeon]
MAQSVVSDGIILVAVVIAAATISQVFLSSIGGLQQGSIAMSEKLSDKMETEITVLKAVNTSDTTVKVWIKNTGTNIIPSAYIMEGDVLFGEYGNFAYQTYSESGAGWTFTILGGSDNNWQGSETIELTITSASAFSEGDYYFSYITHNGIKDEVIFTIGD